MNDKLYTKAVITRASKDKDSDFIAIASTAVEDRHGEVVNVDGWDLKAFKENPILLWAHQHDEIGIGQAKKFWVEGSGKKAKLMIEGFIHEATEKSRALKYLVSEGIIKTVSVGFKPIEMEGSTYTKQELLEVSLVNVPANSQAMVSAVKGLRKAGFKDETINDVGIPVAVLDEMEIMKKDISNLQSVVKTPVPVAPQGRSSRVIRDRQAMVKIIARASDTLLESKALPKEKTELVKVIKKASEKLSLSHKEQLNGKT